MNVLRRLGLLLIASCACSSPALAQESAAVHPWLEDDFIASLGGFLPSKEFRIRVDGNVPGRDIDFDKDAAVIDDETTAALSFRWKFGEKWSVAGQYYTTRDSRQAILQEDLTWRDNVLHAGSNVGAGADLDLFRVFFGREFFTDAPQHEFGLGAGLHWLQIGAYVEGEMFVNDESRGFRRESVTADLPLPNVGAWYWRSLSPRWLLTGRLDWFGASFGDYSGSLWNAGLGVNFQAWEHLGFGLSWQYFEVDVDVDKSNWHGNVQLIQDGPFLSVNVNW
jgi:hypothetical protein